MNRLENEQRYWNAGYERVIGIDEAGRGCLAGPVCVAGVIFPNGSSTIDLPAVRDSKKLSPEQRNRLFDEIVKVPGIQYQILFGSVEDIDYYNILHCTLRLMIQIAYSLNAQIALIDGNQIPTMKHYDQGMMTDLIRYQNIQCVPLVKGDDKSLSISAASILAKVSRDRHMEELANSNHEWKSKYQWHLNHGYPTIEHRTGLVQHGPCEHHRRTFKWTAPASTIATTATTTATTATIASTATTAAATTAAFAFSDSTDEKKKQEEGKRKQKFIPQTEAERIAYEAGYQDGYTIGMINNKDQQQIKKRRKIITKHQSSLQIASPLYS
jgi:ribonuclease HII